VQRSGFDIYLPRGIVNDDGKWVGLSKEERRVRQSAAEGIRAFGKTASKTLFEEPQPRSTGSAKAKFNMSDHRRRRRHPGALQQTRRLVQSLGHGPHRAARCASSRLVIGSRSPPSQRKQPLAAPSGNAGHTDVRRSDIFEPSCRGTLAAAAGLRPDPLPELLLVSWVRTRDGAGVGDGLRR